MPMVFAALHMIFNTLHAGTDIDEILRMSEKTRENPLIPRDGNLCRYGAQNRSLKNLTEIRAAIPPFFPAKRLEIAK